MSTYIRKRINGKNVRIHRYIMEQFLGRKLEDYEIVHHIDGDKSNNNIENLKVMTLREHTKMHVTQRTLSDNTKEIYRNTLNKLRPLMCEKYRKPVAQCDENFKILKTYNSIKETYVDGFSPRWVSACCRGIRKTHKGFYWKFLPKADVTQK